ncbi:protein GOLVEN 7 [Alnus glutinosa]|uniref:protein GOLVEN 7 n=1 Tax=Alnus glutinosa TaxID=3517 RepID=UPI002D796F3E|nr:protein GOLVEN 7 [Alnus glutinosa]
MAPIKLACLFLVFLSTTTACLSLPHSSQDKTASTEVDAVSSAKLGVVENGRGTTTTSTVYRNKRIKGRKMAAAGNETKEQKKDEGAVNGRTSSNISSTEEGSNVGYSRFPEEDDEAGLGFVAFNADYKAPRHHPPANN